MSETIPADGAQAPRQRLMIREMILHNFKSYAGEQRVGPFHKSFSAVVGPNGSGKSNVIDAMLFVFGRRAKQLRFNKVSELIHNSQNFRNLDSARVTVCFQEILDEDGDGYTVVPGSEFTVARTAQRNNESHYYINGRKVSTKDVTDLLKGKGIDLDNNRFLILQGEVEQISMMKPKAEDKNDTGLLEYLEDIIGTEKYVQPIEEAYKKLEEVNEKRQGMVVRLKVSEKEKDALKDKAEEAQQFLNRQAEMLRCRINATHVFTMKAEANIQTTESKAGQLKEKLAYERNKCKDQEKELSAVEKKYVAAEKAHAAVLKAIEAANEAYKEMERKDARNNETVKAIKTKLKKAGDKLAADTTQLEKLEVERKECEEAAPQLAAQVQALTAELATAEEFLEALQEAAKGEVEAYHQQLSQVRKDLAPWDKKISEVTARISVGEREMALLQRQQTDAKKRLQEATKELDEARKAAGDKAKRITDLEAALEARRAQIEEQRKELAAAEAAETRAEEELGAVRERMVQLRADLNATQGQSGVLKELMAAKSRGELSGIYGRLGDLGAIDAQYDAAVSTAVGALDNILVETASDAQRAVEHLRRTGAGCATFLILEKQQHLVRSASERIDTPEGCPRLFDLIKVKDAKLRPAFFYACGNTLVAKDLDQASRIAYGQDRRFRRVVSLQGQLIADSGTMSGGGRPQTGRMTLGSAAPRGAATDARAAEAELRQVEQQAEGLNQTLQAARARGSAAQSAVRAAERELTSLELELPKARMEAEANTTRAADLERSIAGLQQATQVSEADASRIEELQRTVSHEKVALLNLKEQCADLEKKAASLQTRINNAGGDRLKQAKAKVEKTRKKIEELETEASKKQVQAKSHAKQAEKLAKDIAKQGKDKEKMEADLEACAQVTKQIEDAAEKVLIEKQEAEQKGQETGAELQAARIARDTLKSTVEVVRRTEVQISEELERLAAICKEERATCAVHLDERAKHRKKLAEVMGKNDYMVDEAALRGDTPDSELTKLGDEFIFKATVLENELVKLNPDLSTIEEYRQKADEFAARSKELDEATTERDALRKEHETLRKARLDGFMAGFDAISLRLKEVYQMITCGGDAELELVDSLDPFSEGIVFSVRPPKKSWKNISNLSGGEKTLSSLSLVFALHTYKPNPLYVMDEIDAALDFKNVSIVGHYIKERTAGAQFIIISLRNNMFELAERLVGIFKTNNATKTVAINPGAFATVKPDQHAKQDAGQRMDQGGLDEQQQQSAGPGMQGGMGPVQVEMTA